MCLVQGLEPPLCHPHSYKSVFHEHLNTDFQKGDVWQRDSSESDLSEDVVIARVSIQEAFYVAARVSVHCGGTAGGTAGSAGQIRRRWRLWGSWKTQKE